MAKVTPIDKLNKKIEEILQEYGKDVEVNLATATKKIGQAGATALRQESRAKFKGTGKYASGWKSQFTERRLSSSSIIYNEHPGLPHLLEYGHAKRGGGRVEGRAHISTVEEQIERQFMQEVESKL